MTNSSVSKQGARANIDATAVINKLEISPGEVIADLGCGRGSFAFKFAKLTQSAVYAADTDISVLNSVRKRRDDNKQDNVEIVLSAESDANLPGACDLIFLRYVFHHIEEPALYFLGLQKYLKPGGRLAVIDWKPGTGHNGHESSETGIYRTLLSAGYMRIRSYDFLKEQSFNIFRPYP